MPRLAVEPLEDRVVPATYFFENTASIAIPDSGAAAPYPSAISVAALTGTVTNVSVTLVNFSHTFPDDVDVLLQAPGGGTVLLMSDAGGSNPGVSNVSYTFVDGSPAMSDGTASPNGTYSPTNFVAADNFSAPAPVVGPYGATLAGLNGSNPNGTWNLFVVDDATGDLGSIAGGWRLAVTTNTGANFPYNAATNPAVAGYTLGVNGTVLEVRNSGTNALLASQPVAGTTTTLLTGLATSDFVSIQSTPAGVATTYEGTDGTDLIRIGNAGILTGIQGSVLISNNGTAGENDIFVDDTSSSTGLTYTATDGSLTITGVAAITYDSADTDDLTVNAGDGADTFTITGVNGGNFTPVTTFNGGGGIDMFNLTATGIPANGAVVINGGTSGDFVTITGFAPNANSPITVNGGGNAGDNLTVNDSAAAATGQYGVSNTQLTKTGNGSVNYTGLASIQLNTGTQGDNVFVTRTAGAAVGVNTGGGADTIIFDPGASLGGTVDGGNGTDTLQYLAYTTPVAVNLGLGVAGLTAALDGGQEVPSTGSAAAGTATFSNYNALTKTFDLNLTVGGLAPAAVTGIHLHRGGLGTIGPIVLDLLALGTLLPNGTGFTLALNGLDVDAFLLGGAANEAAFLGGQTYLNVHTAAFPNGAIRGQVFSTGNVSLVSGTATGTAGVANVENALGGVGDDSLVGSFAANILNGSGGNDTLLGGPGADTFVGGANDDTLIWSNGDGSDVMDGEAGADAVVVNGNLTGNDVFTVAANGPRVDFDRTSTGPFSLDIGTTETLRVNGGAAGDETYTVSALAGVANLTAVQLFGLAGTDTFEVTPSTVPVSVFGGSGTDTLNLGATAGPSDPFFTPATDPAGGVTGSITFTSLAGVSFSQIELPPDPFNFLTVTATDGITTAAAGSTVTITVVVTNNSPLGIGNIVVSDLFAPELTGITWTAAYTGSRSSGAAGGSGDIAELVNLDAGGSVTYSVTAKLRTDVVGSYTNTATATLPAGLVEGNPADNTATDATDITAALPPTPVVTGPGGGSGLRFASSGGQLVAPQTVAFFPGFGGEVHVAQGDVDGDGVFDIVAATGPGAGVFQVVRGSDGAAVTQIEPFPGYAGGLFVAVGDLTGDGRADIAVMPDAASAFSGPINRELPVRVYSGADFSVVAAFNGLADLQGASGENDGTRLGGRPAIADVNGDGTPDLLVAAGNGGGPRVTVWSGLGFPSAGGGKPTVNPITNLFVFESSQRGGAFVTAGDVSGDGVADIIVGGGPGGGPRVRIVSGAKLFGLSNLDVNLDDPVNLSNGLVLNNFIAGDVNLRGGLRVAVVDVDADGRADLVTGSGTAEPSSVRVYTGLALEGAFGTSSEPGVNQVLDPFAAVVPGGVWVG